MPLLATQGYFARVAGELPPRQRFPRRGLPPSWPAALGTRDRLRVLGPHGRIVREVLLQQPGCQFPGESAGATFPLREGDGGRRRSAVEIEIKGRSGLLQPLPSALFAEGVRCAWMFVHSRLPLRKKQGTSPSRLSHSVCAAAITGMDPRCPRKSES
jgi:hypothetical protein